MIYYTDGSCRQNKVGAFGFICLKDNQLIKEYALRVEDTTNNSMELMGVLAALKHSPRNSEITIYSDSQGAINWIQKTWNCTKPHLQAIVALCDQEIANKNLTVQLVWVKGHAKNAFNNQIDKLVQECSK